MPRYAEGSTALATVYTNHTSILKEKILGQKSVSLVIANSHEEKDVVAKVCVSNDPKGSTASFVDYLISPADTGSETVKTIGEGAGAVIELPGPYAWVDVQIQSEDEDSPQASVWLIAVES